LKIAVLTMESMARWFLRGSGRQSVIPYLHGSVNVLLEVSLRASLVMLVFSVPPSTVAISALL